MVTISSSSTVTTVISSFIADSRFKLKALLNKSILIGNLRNKNKLNILTTLSETETEEK